MTEKKKAWIRPAKTNRPAALRPDSVSSPMSTETISAETSLGEAAPSEATSLTSGSLLTIVADKTADCDQDQGNCQQEGAARSSSTTGAHSHAHHHDHVGGCCATTSPFAAAAAMEKATAAASAATGDTSAATDSNPDANSVASESTIDDAALIEALREVIDPELMINIVDLGLVYSINHTDRKVAVDMTLTSPACPAGPQIIMQSKMALEKLDGVDVAEIKLVMSPPWTPARMTDEARDQLGIF